MVIRDNYVEYANIARVRKNKVDIPRLQEMLRECKQKSRYTNNEISKLLGVPLTMVGHWFRTDGCFSIPDETIWLKLKALLNCPSDFDEAILIFEEKENVYEKSNRFYIASKISPTITTMCGNDKVIVRKRTR